MWRRSPERRSASALCTEVQRSPAYSTAREHSILRHVPQPRPWRPSREGRSTVLRGRPKGATYSGHPVARRAVAASRPYAAVSPPPAEASAPVRRSIRACPAEPPAEQGLVQQWSCSPLRFAPGEHNPQGSPSVFSRGRHSRLHGSASESAPDEHRTNRRP